MVDRRSLISADYESQLREMHAAKKFSGGGALYAEQVVELADSVVAETILDYGCGSSLLTCTLPERFSVFEYDPAVQGRDQLPHPADVVVCTDVLEHVEPEKVDAVLQHIFDLTLKGCFVVIATRPADKRLPDGRNAHLVIDNAAWWAGKLRQHPWRMNIREVNPDHMIVWLRNDSL